MEACTEPVWGDRFHKDSGVVYESGGRRHRCGYGGKGKDSKDARNTFIFAIYSVQVRLRRQLLRTSYTIFLPIKTICRGKLDLYNKF